MHAYVSPRPSWFILGTMAALDHVVFIWFQFKEQKEMKKKINEIKNYKKNQEMTMNNMKTKLKQNQNNNKINKIKN